MLEEAEKTPNVVKCTNRKGLYEELEDIQRRFDYIQYLQWIYIIQMMYFYRLSVCEKALAEYLETKRLAFPRFYFISSADLLDILSKGNQPSLVTMCYTLSML